MRRPLRLSFEKENNENVLLEYHQLKDEIKNLEDFVVSESPLVTISFEGLFTLFDGKIVSILTNHNTSRCSVCDATGQEMGQNISSVRFSTLLCPLPYFLQSVS